MEMFSGQWNSKQLQNHWNKIAQDMNDFSGAPSTLYYRTSEQEIIKEFLGSLKGKQFLKLDLWNEVNNTKILFWIARQGAKITAIDISPYLVKKAKQNFRQEKLTGEFIACDMRRLKLKNNSFDLVYTMGTIEHVHDYEVAIREIYRILKPGGRAIIGVPNKMDPFLRPLMVTMMDWFGLYAYSPEHSFTRWGFHKLLKRNGFLLKGDSGVLFMPGILRMADIYLYKHLCFLNFITTWILKPFEYLERKYPLVRRHSYLMACYVEKPPIRTN
jgi:SAM-dependent methyltransferase